MKHTIFAQSGFSLFEVLVTLGVVSVALLGLFQVAHAVQTSGQVRHADQLLTSIVTEARSYKKLHGSYAALNCDTSDAACYFVDRKLIARGQKNSFNGDIFINNDGDENLTVSLQNIPQNACPDLVMSMNGGRPPSSIELFNPDQESTTDNAEAEDLPPCDEVLNASKNPAAGGTASGQPGQGKISQTKCVAETAGGPKSFVVSSFHSFPVNVADAAYLCSTAQDHTIAWTL